jgi:FkbM family methyltransferase
MKLYSLKQGRFSWLKELWRQLAKRYMHYQAIRHRRASRRQVAIFAFEHVGQAIEFDGVYELGELEALFAWAEVVAPGSFKNATALDIGANIGNHSLFFSDYFAKVESFEPSFQAFRLLEYNASLVGNIRCHNFGLSDAEGKAGLFVHDSNRGASRIVTMGESISERIRLIRLDDVAGLDGDIKLVKIDVEGHEASVLLGAEKLIRQHQPIVIFELGPDEFVYGRPQSVEILKGYGYRHFATIQLHPRLGPCWPKRLRVIIESCWRYLVGKEMSVVLEDDLRPDFYHMVVAIPEWVQLPASAR